MLPPATSQSLIKAAGKPGRFSRTETGTCRADDRPECVCIHCRPPSRTVQNLQDVQGSTQISPICISAFRKQSQEVDPPTPASRCMEQCQYGGMGGGGRGWKRGKGFYAAFNCSTASPAGYQAPFSLIKRAGKQKAIILCIISGAKRQFMLFYYFCGGSGGGDGGRGGMSLSTYEKNNNPLSAAHSVLLSLRSYLSLRVQIVSFLQLLVVIRVSPCKSTTNQTKPSDFSRQEVLNLTTTLLMVLSLCLQLIMCSGCLPNRTSPWPDGSARMAFPRVCGIRSPPRPSVPCRACFPIPLRSCLNWWRESCEWFSTSIRTGRSCVQC